MQLLKIVLHVHNGGKVHGKSVATKVGWRDLFTTHKLMDADQLTPELAQDAPRHSMQRLLSPLLVAAIPAKEAEPFLLMRHYAKRMCPISYALERGGERSLSGW